MHVTIKTLNLIYDTRLSDQQIVFSPSKHQHIPFLNLLVLLKLLRCRMWIRLDLLSY